MAPLLFWERGSFGCRLLPGLAQQLPKFQACTQAMVVSRCTL